MTKTASKIAYLDGIRGVAAFLVFLHHFLLAFYSAYYSLNVNESHLNNLEIKFGQSVFSVLSSGNFSVRIFFVLSGYVLSRKYYQTHLFDVIVSGAQRRFLRLYIPIAVTLIFSYFIMRAGLYYNVPASKITRSGWWLGGLWTFQDPLQKLWYCLTAGTMFMGDASFDTSLWTMTVELTGSFFVFAFLAFTHNTKNSFTSLILVFIYCVFTGQAVLCAFVFGISLNYVEDTADKLNKYFKHFAAILLFITGWVLGSYPAAETVKDTIFEHIPAAIMQCSAWFHVVGAYFIVLAFVISPFFQKTISFGLFRFLGHISFSLYLLHPLIIGSFSCFVFLKIYGHFGYNHSVLIVFLLTIGLMLVMSWLMTKYIDDPGIRFSKYVYSRWIKKKPATVDAPSTK